MKTLSKFFNFRAMSFSGAAFLMATSAVGPGFITQTTVFTIDLLYDFGFVILISVIVDIIVQLNIWRIVLQRRQTAAVIADSVFKGGGHLLAAMVVLGGLVFNIGNISGCGLGLEALLNIDVKSGAIVSGLLAMGIFAVSAFGRILDAFTKVLGILMLLIIAWIALHHLPPLAPTVKHMAMPSGMHYTAILTLVGGTVGGYISFAGAHRLLDASAGTIVTTKTIDRQATTGIVLAALVRVGLFLAILGIIVKGFSPNMGNPTASIFEAALGTVGQKMFGLILWCASITSVVGASYTSISFMEIYSGLFRRQRHLAIAAFIALSATVFVVHGNPVKVLLIAGAVNALVLPFGLAVLLWAAKRPAVTNGYKHPVWMQMAGWLVVLAVAFMAYSAFQRM